MNIWFFYEEFFLLEKVTSRKHYKSISKIEKCWVYVLSSFFRNRRDASDICWLCMCPDVVSMLYDTFYFSIEPFYIISDIPRYIFHRYNTSYSLVCSRTSCSDFVSIPEFGEFFDNWFDCLFFISIDSESPDFFEVFFISTIFQEICMEKKISFCVFFEVKKQSKRRYLFPVFSWECLPETTKNPYIFVFICDIENLFTGFIFLRFFSSWRLLDFSDEFPEKKDAKTRSTGMMVFYRHWKAILS